MSTISKIFYSILFIIFSLNSVSANQNTIDNCNKFSHINKELKIKKIKIKIKNNRKWQVNNLRILIDNTHVIPNKLKKNAFKSLKKHHFPKKENNKRQKKCVFL